MRASSGQMSGTTEELKYKQMDGALVLPGDRIGSAEEFVPGHDTYVFGGNIYASTTGVVDIDPESRLVSVIPRSNALPRVENGDIVVGEVVDIKENLVILALAFKKGYESRPLPELDATIHISNVKSSYVKDLKQMFGLRDIVRAKVIDARQMRLSTEPDDMGVIKAYCSSCTTPLVKKDSRLECPECKRTEMRKLSTYYGTGLV